MTSGVATPEPEWGVTEEEDMPRISATAVDELATRRLEAMNRDRWARPRRWVFPGVLESEGQGLKN